MSLEHPFDRPVIILAAPRSGSTLLYEVLATAEDFWTVGGESHMLIESLPELSPASGSVESNRLTGEDASPELIRALQDNFAYALRDHKGRLWVKHQEVKRLRFLEKTPKNALRQPLLEKVFPDASYIYLYRDPRENISSMMEAWKSGGWVTYPRLKNWRGPPWSLLLPPDWSAMNGRPLEQICAFQWDAANRIILDDLAVIEPERWTAIDYRSLTENTNDEIRRLCTFAGIPVDENLSGHLAEPLPLSRYTLTPPRKEKWRQNEDAIQSIMDSVQATDQRAREVLARKEEQVARN